MGKDKKNKERFVLTVIKQIDSGAGEFDKLYIMEVQRYKSYGDAFAAMYFRAEEIYNDKIYIADYSDNVDIVLENKKGYWIGRVDLDDDYGYMELYTSNGRYTISFYRIGYCNEAEYEVAIC